MKQDCLNYLMLLHVHKDKTDELDLKLLVNEFIYSDHRSNIFAKMEKFLLVLPTINHLHVLYYLSYKEVYFNHT